MELEDLVDRVRALSSVLLQELKIESQLFLSLVWFLGADPVSPLEGTRS
jgi:hypothetical protein